MNFKTTSLSEKFEALFGKMENFLKTETVIGEPIVVGKITLVPIISVVFGGGTGIGVGLSPEGYERGDGGTGISAKIIPDTILVIKNNEISMIPVRGKNSIETLVEMIPEIISKVDSKKVL